MRRYVGTVYRTAEPHFRHAVMTDAESFDEAWDYVRRTTPSDWSILWLQPQDPLSVS